MNNSIESFLGEERSVFEGLLNAVDYSSLRGERKANFDRALSGLQDDQPQTVFDLTLASANVANNRTELDHIAAALGGLFASNVSVIEAMEKGLRTYAQQVRKGSLRVEAGKLADLLSEITGSPMGRAVTDGTDGVSDRGLTEVPCDALLC